MPSNAFPEDRNLDAPVGLRLCAITHVKHLSYLSFSLSLDPALSQASIYSKLFYSTRTANIRT